VSATIYDIADKANVSIATVSRVFSNHPRVSEKTRAKVLAIAEQHHYYPNVSAQALARQNSFMMAAVVPMLTNYFFMEVLRGVQDKMAESGYDLMVFSVSDPSESMTPLYRAMQKGRSEGVFLFSTYLPDAEAKRLAKNGHPILLVDCCHDLLDSIAVDNVAGAYVATQHLLQLGHQKIALLGADPVSGPAQERKRGFLQAIWEAGLYVPESMIQDCTNCTSHGFSEEAGYQTAMKVLELHPDIEAFFAMSDIQALGALKALHQHGKVPGQDVSIIGFDDIQVAEYVGLTTMRQPMYEMGQQAFELLKSKMEGNRTVTGLRKMAPQLIVRSSTRNL
jgi:LacI family transcriptional regulator